MSVGNGSHEINQNLEVLQLLSRPKFRCVAHSSTKFREYSQSQSSASNCDATEKRDETEMVKARRKFSAS